MSPAHPLPYIERAYDETLHLLEEARDYARRMARGDNMRDRHGDRLVVSCEAMRVTSRLTQAMAWLMVWRAVQSGELDVEEALDERYRLSGLRVCLDEGHHNDADLPLTLRSLLERSFKLYRRIARLERMQTRKRRQAVSPRRSLRPPHPAK